MSDEQRAVAEVDRDDAGVVRVSAVDKSMDELVALCKRRGFVYPASEIYGGINGFWDYGPLGTTLKNNLRDLWWRDMVECPPDGPLDGKPVSIVGLDSAIIQNPKVWEASGHVGGFNDPMVDCTKCNARFRFSDFLEHNLDAVHEVLSGLQLESIPFRWADDSSLSDSPWDHLRKQAHWHEERLSKDIDSALAGLENDYDLGPWITAAEACCCPNCRAKGLAENKKRRFLGPRQFGLMFESHAGALRDDSNKVYLRPETAQGIFTNYKNVLDTMRVKVPFGIAQVGKSFRNEITPRNFIFRSREFEQMEMEFFCHPDEAQVWYEFWVDQRMKWWQKLGLASANLIRREHDADELAHYSTACADIEYQYPFTAPGFGELEGISHRGDFDLTQHQKHAKLKLEYFDQARNERYMPQVIEPAAGLTRGMLALLCEAFTPDPSRPSKVFMKFDPKVAPIQAAVFPLMNKDGMPEVAEKLYKQLRRKFAVQLDVKQNIGKRYARMDEAGTPFCFTVDSDSLTDQTVTVRWRDTCAQERMGLDAVGAFLEANIEGDDGAG